jgi:hypothetical protein
LIGQPYSLQTWGTVIGAELIEFRPQNRQFPCIFPC